MATADKHEPTENEMNLDDLEVGEIEEIPEYEPLEELNVISVKREDTRGRLAIYFLVGFFIILIVGMIIAALNEGDKVGSVTQIMIAISGILSGPLGFVMGYYFRSRDEN